MMLSPAYITLDEAEYRVLRKFVEMLGEHVKAGYSGTSGGQVAYAIVKADEGYKTVLLEDSAESHAYLYLYAEAYNWQVIKRVRIHPDTYEYSEA